MRCAPLLLLFGAALAGCGYIGDPLPPALNIPRAVADLHGVQRGDQIVVAFTPTLEATDGLILPKLAEIELRAGPSSAEPFEAAGWAAQARRIPVPTALAQPQEVSFPATGWAGKSVIVAVRTLGPRGKASAWSNLLVLDVVEPLARTTGLKGEALSRGVFLSWTAGSGGPWRVWRVNAGEEEPALLGVAAEASWLDATAEYGKAYAYTVQRIRKSGEREAESELSAEVKVQYEDTFAPAVPVGLTAIAGLKTIELNWDRNREGDFKGCQVYRSEEGGDWLKVGPLLENPSFSDDTVVSGKRYRYAVTALDEKGNESVRSAPVELTAP